jgi:putative endonuclease
MINKRSRGQKYEELAKRFLQQKGYEIITSNFRLGHHEIDIICVKENTLVFVEVKGGRSTVFGDPVHRVDQRKRDSIIEVAQGYLQQSHITYTDYRFDVIVVKDRGGKLEVNQIEGAFTL